MCALFASECGFGDFDYINAMVMVMILMLMLMVMIFNDDGYQILGQPQEPRQGAGDFQVVQGSSKGFLCCRL